MLSYVLQQGANVHGLLADETFDRVGEEAVPARKVLEKLVAHGWDINSCSDASGSEPLLWLVFTTTVLLSGASNKAPVSNIPTSQAALNRYWRQLLRAATSRHSNFSGRRAPVSLGDCCPKQCNQLPTIHPEATSATKTTTRSIKSM